MDCQHEVGHSMQHSTYTFLETKEALVHPDFVPDAKHTQLRGFMVESLQTELEHVSMSVGLWSGQFVHRLHLI